MARPTVTEITENYTKRPVWAEIDLDRAAENMREIRRRSEERRVGEESRRRWGAWRWRGRR